MKCLAKYISPEMAEIIQKPENKAEELNRQIERLTEMSEKVDYFSDKEISIQTDIVQSLKKQVDRFERLISEGFVEFVPAIEPTIQEDEKMILSYEFKDGKVLQIWSVSKDVKYYNKRVQELKNELATSDYKIIKCYEASLAGETCPYDASELINRRNVIRAQINAIEAKIEKL